MNTTENIGLTSIYSFQCYRKPDNMSVEDWMSLSGEERIANGVLKWEDEINNTVVNVGLDDVLDKYFKGSAYTAAHYVGLMSGTPTVAAADTMASHAGWTEVTAYSEANRQDLTLGSVSGQSVDNSASKAVFTINSDSTTLGGAFTTTNSTKGGTTGILYGAAAFPAGNKLLDNTDVLQVTVNLTVASV